MLKQKKIYVHRKHNNIRAYSSLKEFCLEKKNNFVYYTVLI